MKQMMARVCAVLALLCAAAHAGTVVQSLFSSDVESWTVEGSSVGALTRESSGGKIKAADTSNSIWYFVAPAKFLGDQTAGYGGSLQFMLGHFDYNTDDKAALSASDVIIETTCGYMLTASNVFTNYLMSSTYTVTLTESGGWIDSRTGRAPGMMDMLGALNNIKAIKIRGGFYVGSETTFLGTVSIIAGSTHWKPCCTINNVVDVCAVAGSPYYNPSSLKFYCQGSKAQTIKITSITPTWGRESGGTVITLTGENFGLTTSTPTISVGGKPCVASTVTTADTTATCVTPPGTGTNVDVTVTAALSSADEYATSCINAGARQFSYGGHDVDWSKHFIPSAASKSAAVTGVASNRNTGAVYVTGWYTGQLTIGSTTLTDATTNTNAFVAKYDREGSLSWAVDAGSSLASDAGYAIAVDEFTDEVYVTGIARGNANFPVGSGNFDPTVASTNTAMFVAKYVGATGVPSWVSFGKNGDGGDSVEGKAITVDRGVAYVVGTIVETSAGSSTFDFGNSKTITSLTAARTDGYIAAYAGTTGLCSWVSNVYMTAATASTTTITAVSSYKTAVFITGHVDGGATTVGGVSLSSTVASGTTNTGYATAATLNGKTVGFVGRYTSAGVAELVTATSYSSTDAFNQIWPLGIYATLDSVFVVGKYRTKLTHTVSFSDSVSAPTALADNDDEAFLVKYSSDLVAQWGRYMQAASSTETYDGVVVETLSGDIYVSGTFGATVYYSGPTSHLFSTTANTDYITHENFASGGGGAVATKGQLIKYDTWGTAKWAKRFGAEAASASALPAIAKLDDTVFVGGSFLGSMAVPTGNTCAAEGANCLVATSSSQDAFFTKLVA